MTDFHRHLAAGEVPEVALQKTITGYLDTATVLTKKLYFWAPYFLARIGRTSGVNLGMPDAAGAPG